MTYAAAEKFAEDAAQRKKGHFYMNNFLFYDIETTGLNPAFDQILQFAAIRTDEHLAEIDRHTLQIRLRPDVVPSPNAVLTHRIQTQKMTSGTCEFEGIRKIHQWVNQPGTISLGYNTLNFDDIFLRFGFHRNLLDPYTHQYHNGCSRMDLYPMVITYWLYRPGVMQWPESNGRVSLKLEDLNTANRWVSGPSHDALTDTMVTLALAETLANEKEMWNYLVQFFNKSTDAIRMDKLPVELESQAEHHRLALMISGEFGLTHACQAPVLYLGNSIPYSNQTLWLRLDLPELQTTSMDSMDKTTWVVRKKWGEPGFILPPLDRFWQHLPDQRRTIVGENLAWLKSNPDRFHEIIKYHCEFRYPDVPHVDADAALYRMGFLNRQGRQHCQAIHDTNTENMPKLIPQLPNPVTRELARRILFRNYPEKLNDALIQSYHQYNDRVRPENDDEAMVDYKGNHRRTPKSALEEIEAIKKENDLSGSDMELLDDLKNYILEAFQKN